MPIRVPTVAFLLIMLTTVPGCGTTLPNQDPVGRPFPSVTGESLEGTEVALPNRLRGEPAVVLAGYAQATQFDIDRWMLGLLQMDATIATLEVPAIDGWFPSTFLRPTIDTGMRDGIPREDWASVVTLYGDEARRLQTFTGTERPGNARVLLLDADGVVRWFWDRGYSPRRLRQMLSTATEGRFRGSSDYDAVPPHHEADRSSHPNH